MVKLFNGSRFIFVVLLLSIAIKLLILFILSPQLFLDGQWYVSVAQRIYEQRFVYPDDELKDAPLTPYFYALFVPLSNLIGNYAYALANILLATASIVILSRISFLVFNNQIVANITALIVCVYPFLNFYSIAVLTETLYIFLLYLSFYYFIIFFKKKHLIFMSLFSLFFALATLTRFSNLPMFPFFLLLAAVLQYRQKRTFKIIVLSIIISVIVFLSAMSVWWVRNYKVFGEFVATSKGESGKVFYSGNNKNNSSGGGIGGLDVDTKLFNNITDPTLRDEAMWRAGLDWIKNNPSDWLKLELKKLIRFYRFTIYAKEYQAWFYKVLSIFSYGIVFILSIYALFRFREYFWDYSPMLLYSFLLTGVHLVFISSVRYRLPIEPFMIILAAPVIHIFLKKVWFWSNDKV